MFCDFLRDALVCTAVRKYFLNLKTFFILGLAVIFSHTAFAERAANHKMLLWGETKLYLSHWAMFHPPHARQVLMEVELSPQDKATFDEGRDSTQFNSINPDDFHLGNFMQTPHDLIAEVYNGHAERGGEVIEGMDRVTFKIKKILFKRDFVTTDRHVQPFESARYLLIGNGSEKYYLAHKIKAKSPDENKPEFDKILEVSFSESMKSQVDQKLESNGNIELEIPTLNNLTPLKKDDEVVAKSPELTGDLVIKALKEIYFETSDFTF